MAEKGGSNFQNFMSNLGNRHFTSTAMRTFAPAVWVLFVLTFVLPGGATTYYVNSANPAPVSPYVTWSTAATNIQDAVTVASAGDTVLVTNGIYAYGGIPQGATTNRVCVTKALTVQSVNGPLATVIQGAGINFNANAVRCAWLTNGATLNGFTLRYGGVVNISSDNSGGGVACYSNAIVENCLIYFNAAAYGGGTYQGAIQNCQIYSNTATYGGGVYKGSLVNCGINNNGASNSGSGGGGANSSSLLNCTVTGSTNGYGIFSSYATNCIVYYNNQGNIINSRHAGGLLLCHPLARSHRQLHQRSRSLRGQSSSSARLPLHWHREKRCHRHRYFWADLEHAAFHWLRRMATRARRPHPHDHFQQQPGRIYL